MTQDRNIHLIRDFFLSERVLSSIRGVQRQVWKQEQDSVYICCRTFWNIELPLAERTVRFLCSPGRSFSFPSLCEICPERGPTFQRFWSNRLEKNACRPSWRAFPPRVFALTNRSVKEAIEHIVSLVTAINFVVVGYTDRYGSPCNFGDCYSDRRSWCGRGCIHLHFHEKGGAV